jgi:hypothetical protein
VLITAPAIVRAGSLMPVKAIKPAGEVINYLGYDFVEECMFLRALFGTLAKYPNRTATQVIEMLKASDVSIEMLNKGSWAR